MLGKNFLKTLSVHFGSKNRKLNCNKTKTWIKSFEQLPYGYLEQVVS